MISPTPFSDADDSIAEACAWLDGLAQKKPLLSTEDDIEQVQYHLMRASDALHAFGCAGGPDSLRRRLEDIDRVLAAAQAESLNVTWG